MGGWGLVEVTKGILCRALVKAVAMQTSGADKQLVAEPWTSGLQTAC